jgi:hypothetical protein
MQRFIKIGMLLVIVLGLTAAGCSSSKKSTCGCAGMVGY